MVSGIANRFIDNCSVMPIGTDMTKTRTDHLPVRFLLDNFNEIMNSINKEFNRYLIVSKEDEAASQKPLEQRSVRLRASVRVLPEPFGVARTSMENILGRHKAGREDLKTIFGDCETIAQLRQIIAKLEEILPQECLEKDDRLQRCRAACESIESVLEKLGLREELEAKKASEKNAIEQRMRTVADEESVPILVRKVSGQDVPRKLSPAERVDLLAEIDELFDEGGKKEEAIMKIDKLFVDYADGLGFIEGERFNLVIDDLTRYVKKEWDLRNERYREEGKEAVAKIFEAKVDADEHFLRTWVMQAIDLDMNCCITKSEAIQGFEKVLGEINTSWASERTGSKQSGGSGYQS